MRDFVTDVIDVLIEGIGVIVGALLVVAGIVGLVYWGESASCNGKADALNRDTQFVAHHIVDWDCYVDTDNGWVPVDKIREVEVTK